MYLNKTQLGSVGRAVPAIMYAKSKASYEIYMYIIYSTVWSVLCTNR